MSDIERIPVSQLPAGGDPVLGNPLPGTLPSPVLLINNKMPGTESKAKLTPFTDNSVEISKKLSKLAFAPRTGKSPWPG